MSAHDDQYITLADMERLWSNRCTTYGRMATSSRSRRENRRGASLKRAGVAQHTSEKLDFSPFLCKITSAFAFRNRG